MAAGSLQQPFHCQRDGLRPASHQGTVQYFSHRNEIARGPAELVQHFRGSSHRRKSAACPNFDMIWLHRSPIPVGRRGVISSFKWFLPAFATRRGWERGSAPCGIYSLRLELLYWLPGLTASWDFLRLYRLIDWSRFLHVFTSHVLYVRPRGR